MPRPPKRRLVEELPASDYFKPAGIPMRALDEVVLSIDELESIRLKDYEGLDHADSADRMQVSRPTFHRILTAAHRKVAEALTQGKAIRIHGGIYRIAGRHRCQECGHVWIDPEDGAVPICPDCGTEDILRAGPRRHGRRHGHRGPRGNG